MCFQSQIPTTVPPDASDGQSQTTQQGGAQKSVQPLLGGLGITAGSGSGSGGFSDATLGSSIGADTGKDRGRRDK